APGAWLVLAGTGPGEAAIRGLVAGDDLLSARVCFTGPVAHEDVPALLARFDIGAAPYRPAEDFYFCPLKALEYLAAGVPVVHPGLGDLPTLVAGAGVTYRPGDTHDLAAKIADLVADAERRATMATQARVQGARWSWDESARA